MSAQVLVLAKAPRPGRVKTRLCPPCTPEQAAAVALAALHDTLDAVDEAPTELVARRRLVLDDPTTVDGHGWPRRGWDVGAQREGTLGERIAHAFADSVGDGLPTVLIGMDTPQISGPLLGQCVRQLHGTDAVLGLASDGGWWLLALREPARAWEMAGVSTSRPDTGRLTHAALVEAGLTVATAPVLRDVDTPADAWAVAPLCNPASRFAAAVSRHLRPAGVAT